MTRDSNQSHFYKISEFLMDKFTSFAHKKLSNFVSAMIKLDANFVFCLFGRAQRRSRSRNGLRKESTIFAEAGAGAGVGFLNENRTRSWSRSDNFSFYRSRIMNFINT